MWLVKPMKYAEILFIEQIKLQNKSKRPLLECWQTKKLKYNKPIIFLIMFKFSIQD